MWKFLDRIRDDFDRGLDDLKSEASTEEERKQVQQKAFALGQKAIDGLSVIALQKGTVEFINQDQTQIEIYMDDGTGYGIRMPFGPNPYKVDVSVGQEVREGQPLVTFSSLQHAVHVYYLTPDMIKTLSQERFRIA